MKRWPYVYALLVLLLSLWAGSTTAQSIDTYFSPNGGAAAAVTAEIVHAKKSIRIQAYSIAQTDITAALIAAKLRGIDIALIVDRHQQNDAYSTASKLKKAGISTTVDRAVALAHNKTIVIDDTIVITGSMNFTDAGDRKNSENLLIIRDATIAARYAADWTKRRATASTFAPVHHDDYRPPTPPANLVLPPKPAHAQEP